MYRPESRAPVRFADGDATKLVVEAGRLRQPPSPAHGCSVPRTASSFDDDHPHDPGTRPHDQVGGMRVDACFRYVSPARLRVETAKIRALVGKKPSAARTLPCR